MKIAIMKISALLTLIVQMVVFGEHQDKENTGELSSAKANKFKSSHDGCPKEKIIYKDVHGNVVTFIWPETKPGVSTVSKPLCLSPEGAPQSRRCVMQEDGTTHWMPREAVSCHNWMTIPKDITCPPSFKAVPDQDLCLLVTEPLSGMSSPCLTFGTHVNILELQDHIFRNVIRVLIEQGVSSVWVPARRSAPFGLILNNLPGPKWKEVAHKQLLRHKLSSSWSAKHLCLSLNIFDIEDTILRTENCSGVFLPAVCMISKMNKEKILMDQFCPEGYKASRFGDDDLRKRCFKVEYSQSNISWVQAEKRCSSDNNGKLAYIQSEYDTYIIKELIKTNGIDKESCWFGLTVTDEGMKWSSNDELTVNYVNWKTGIDLKPSTGSGAVQASDGSWVLLPENTSLSCYICEATREQHDVKTDLHLRFNPRHGRLFLSVYWPQGLWRTSNDEDGFRCFTNSGMGLIRPVRTRKKWEKKWTVEDVKLLKQIQEIEMNAYSDAHNHRNQSNIKLRVHKQIFKLRYDKKNSGQYWCEGHFVNGMVQKMSNVILLRAREGNTFSVLMDAHGACRQGVDADISCDPTLSIEPQMVAEKLKNSLSRSRISAISAMKVISIFSNGTLRLLLHVRTSGSHNSLEKDYNETYRVMQRVAERNPNRYTLYSVRSIDSCLADTTGNLNWRTTALGSTAISQVLCIDASTKLLARRQCFGNFVTGGFWDSSSAVSCLEEDKVPYHTRILHTLTKSTSAKSMENILKELLNVLEAQKMHISVTDVYFVACTMTNLASTLFSKNVTLPSFDKVINVLDSVMTMNEDTLAKSQHTFNATNLLLDAVEQFIDRLMLEPGQNGVLQAVSSQIIVQISDPTISNISGLALFRHNVTHVTSFTDLSIVPLRLEQEEYFSAQNMEDLEVAVWIPEEIIMKFRKNGSEAFDNSEIDSEEEVSNNKNYYKLFENMKQKARVAIVIFYSDHIFKETSYPPEEMDSISEEDCLQVPERCRKQTTEPAAISSRIVSVFIPGFGSDLPLPISIIFRPVSEDPSLELEDSQECAFWDFAYNSSSPSSSLGGWTSEGCMYAGNYSYGNSTVNFTRNNTLDICVCTHLSHFAELVRRHYPSPGFDYVGTAGLSDTDRWALEVITLIGCSLSLVGVIGIFFTAVLFRTWRQKPGTKVLLQLSIALGFQMIIFLLSSFDMTETMEVDDELDFLSYPLSPESHHSTRCLAIGATLQYSVMSSFAWMLVTALLQFLRYVRVLGAPRPPRFFLKSMAFAWGVPIIPVVLVLTIDPASYQATDPKSLLCYPTGYSLYLATLLPITLIVGANFVVYVMIICSFVRMSENKDRHSSPILYQQIRLSFMLFFLLGLSWVFGIMAALDFGLTFSYLFCITATLQGFILFVFFVLCDPSTRLLWGSGATSTWKKLTSVGSSSGFLSSNMSTQSVCTLSSDYQKKVSSQKNVF